MNARTLTVLLFVLFGVVYLVAGVSVLAVDSKYLPPQVRPIVMSLVYGDKNVLHLAQELGTQLVILALVTFWFAKNYEQSRLFHWAMTIGWGLFALIHWIDVRGSGDSMNGPALNTIPFGLLAVAGWLRSRSSGR